MDAHDSGSDSTPQVRRSRPDGPPVETSAFAVPAWARDAGRWSWVLIGVGIVLVAVFAVLAATRLLVLAALFAVLVGATFLPVVDWLQRHRFPRWLGAMLVVAASIALAILIGLVVLHGLVNQLPAMEENLDAAVTSLKDTLSSTGVTDEQVESVKKSVQGLIEQGASGASAAVSTLVSSVGSLLFGIFISINIGVWVLIQGRQIGTWASGKMGPVPQPVAYQIISNGARFFRGYIWGSTIVGLFNAAVLGLGALVLGVPLAATIAVLAWLTNYIPYFGAIISGAFAVLIALGAGGPAKAVPMLILVILANGFLQTLISQFALGSALDLHPLVVLFATTAGGILFGAVGGVFAAPFTKIGLDAYARIREAGVLGPVQTGAEAVAVVAGPAHATGPPGPGDRTSGRSVEGEP